MNRVQLTLFSAPLELSRLSESQELKFKSFGRGERAEEADDEDDELRRAGRLLRHLGSRLHQLGGRFAKKRPAPSIRCWNKGKIRFS